MPFENKLELNAKAFFFNAKTDYLPYYKNFSLTVDRGMRLKEVLGMIKEKNRDFSYPDRDLLFRVNNLIVTGEEEVSTIVDRLGTELTIDPALKYRSNNGLILNNRDFMHQFRALLGHYSTKQDLAYYIKLYPVHYASETFNYNHEYIGDAILLLAHKMITDGNEHKDKILKAIANEFDGISCCEYEDNLFASEDHSKAIAELKEMVGVKREKRFMEKILDLTLCKKESITIDSIDDKRVAIYAGDTLSDKLIEETKEIIINSGAKFVEFGMSTKLAGQTLMDSNYEMAYKKAGTMMLDALDSGANVLVFLKDEDLSIFKSILAKSERTMGRDINITLISSVELQELTATVIA
jgi:succinate dehydrogenase/fumarate reductase-like Fe-S protein